MGTDAVLLVQHAGLNQMGSGNPPRAGCPHMNLRRTLQCLVDANLSVVCTATVPGRAHSLHYIRVHGARACMALCVHIISPAMRGTCATLGRPPGNGINVRSGKPRFPKKLTHLGADLGERANA